MDPRPVPSPPGGPPVSNASVLLHNDAGAYLLHLRDNLPGIWEPGSWALPGGGREPGDRSLAETARRELREETGLDLPGLEPFTVETATGIDGSPVLIQVFTARWNGDPATLHLTEGVLLHWFRPEVMPRLRLAPSTLELVHRHAGLPAPTGWPVSPREPPAGETGADPPGRRP
ncbi:NUDIX domain-containing protein [Streptomyces albidoflavus]|uniref:NUDIX domain-containing protein n=1 Tax=Streptomyces albidoflavus TaxID=1886 RepID=A0ABY3H1U8_9ACTN|nr:NUDIX domain-containing protein [Streptomyces albidoflavus]TWV25851.1 NUDIX domain-containing protein [Streptomyces albidoflavus]